MIHPQPIIEFYIQKQSKPLLFDFRFNEVRALYRLGKITEQQLLDYEANYTDTLTNECEYLFELKELKE